MSAAGMAQDANSAHLEGSERREPRGWWST